MAARDDRIGRRLSTLEQWQRDVANELRELEEWRDEIKPFIEQLQADLIYRQRKHAESVGTWTLGTKVVVGIVTLLVGLTTVGSFILQVLHATR